MTQEERDLIEKFVARVGGAASGGWGRSVPSTQPSLPPVDPEADRFIAQQFDTHPEARYRVTQMAVVQEAALAEAANRMQRMQAELDQLRQQAQQAQQAQPAQAPSRGFLGGLFGGAASAPQAPVWNQGQPGMQPQYAPQPQMAPQYPPNMQPGMFQPSAGGTGFLGGALRTAAGVAGGVVAGNLLMDMFSGHQGGGLGGGLGGFGGGGMAGGFGAPSEVTDNTTIINNNYGDAGGQGGIWDNASQGGTDPGASWDSAQGGFDQGGSDPGGSWDDSSGGGGFDDSSS